MTTDPTYRKINDYRFEINKKTLRSLVSDAESSGGKEGVAVADFRVGKFSDSGCKRRG